MIAAATAYELERDGLGLRFLDAVDGVLQRIAERPGIGAPAGGEPPIRRVPVPRFPYLVFYVVTGDVTVLAVAHAKRRPGYWSRRR